LTAVFAELSLAVNDAAGTLDGATVVIAPLANDLDPAAGGLHIVALGEPRRGSIVLADDVVTYTATVGEGGLDELSYMIQDAAGMTATGTIVVVISARTNSATPEVAPVDTTQTTTATFGGRNGALADATPQFLYRRSGCE
jgi:hypothetical protein